MTHPHPWLLVGPWYRWSEPGVAAAGRRSRPILQKYAAPDFVNEFLTEPQHSLKYHDGDWVHEAVGGSYAPALPRRRKVFLDVHSRFYLVVCELHCDVPGFPCPCREQVCEAGFVVRRRRLDAKPEARATLTRFLARLARSGKTLGQLGLAGKAPEPSEGTLAKLLHELRRRQWTKVAAAHAGQLHELNRLVQRQGIRLVLEGWKSGELPGVGAWQEVEEKPEELAEDAFPLYPLIPDPAAADHSAAGRSLWFGLLPTGAAGLEDGGRPRFNDSDLYEVRCFVRRHEPACPRRPTPRDCPGELVWSRPGERYQLAAPADLAGTSHRPVTIRLPDLPALRGQVPAFGVRMVAPAGSSLPFHGGLGSLESEGPGGAQVCFLAIPLITLIATFVLRLFLPIVVFLFGLWFLLRLKLCIPQWVDADLAQRLEDAADAGAENGDELERVLDDLGIPFPDDTPPELPPDAALAWLPSVSAGLEYYQRLEVPAP